MFDARLAAVTMTLTLTLTLIYSVQLALRQISSVYRLVANRVGDWHVDIRKQEGENQHHKTAFGSTFRWRWKLKSVCTLHRAINANR